MKTKYFVNCKAVFQGGGCKTILYIGAYKKALECGISFSSVAGTSAGAIIAALIAAGATPDKMIEILKNIDYDRLSPLNKYSLFIYKIFRYLHIPSLPVIFFLYKAFKEKGYKDNNYIEELINNELIKLLNKEKGYKVTFNDLKIPLQVVISDIKEQQVIIRDSGYVSEAIKCSCAIPFVYKAVDDRYVDGGLISNLPIFVYKNHDTEYDKILAFILKENKLNKINSSKDYFLRLISTGIHGTTNIQNQIIHNCSYVTIPCEKIDLLDFKKLKNRYFITNAIRIGEKAMDSFVQQENNIIEDLNNNNNNNNILRGKAKLRVFVSHQILGNPQNMIISFKNTKWVWELFPLLLYIKNNNINLIIYTEEFNSNNYKKEKIDSEWKKETSRIQLLQYLGFEINIVKLLPVYGYFFKSNNWTGAVSVYDKNEVLESVIYNKKRDNILIQLCINRILENKKSLELLPINNIAIKVIDENIIIKKISDIYYYKNCKIYYDTIKVENLLFLTKQVMGYKYRNIDYFFNLYKNNNIYEFEASEFIFANNKSSLIGPIVLEKYDDKYFVIEGNTRCIYAYKNRIKELKVLIVEGVTTPLPSKGKFKINEVLIIDSVSEGDQRYESWDYKLFRPIESTLRPYDYLD